MARAGRGAVVGRAFWALAPFIPAAPFRLHAGADHPPITVPQVSTLRRAAQRGGDVELTVLTTAKLRPVLVIAEASDPFDGPAVLALRLRRFSKLTDDEQGTVRQGKAEKLFYLRPDRFPGLTEENAAVLPTLIRVAPNALDETSDLGGLDENELRVIHERIVRYFGLDLTVLVRQLLENRLRDVRH
jgi:hypothetical protein